MNKLREQFEEKATAYLQQKNAFIKKSKIQKKEMEALILLSESEEPIRVGDMAGPLGISHSRVTRLMDALTQHRYATRTTSKHDRRCWLAAISKAGSALVESYDAELNKFFEDSE